MKKIIAIFCFVVCTQISFAQKARLDTLLQKIAIEKTDSARFMMMQDFSLVTSESDPVLDFNNLQQLYLYGQKNHDRIVESFALSRSGYNYRSFGNTEKALEYTLHADDLAMETGCLQLQAFAKMNLSYVYKDLGNFPKTIKLLMEVLDLSEKTNFYKATTWAYALLGVTYLDMNKTDSALMYSQRCYELCIQTHYFDYLGYRLTNLADVNAKLGNNAVAIGYYDMAINEGLRIRSPKQLAVSYSAKAQFFQSINKKDSGISYAKKAVDIVKQTPFSNYGLKPAKLLLELYKPINSDSALKYSELYRNIYDSVYSARAIQQTQLLTFENQVKQEKLAEEKLKAAEERQENIQYALIALGIIILLSLYLLLSRSFITNTKMIEFLGVIALLIVFEFLNLLLHPFLERITHHSPLLMLLSLVCIAALLVPLHHKLEHWATHKLVEKNKAIRLASAKKTIEQLEKN